VILFVLDFVILKPATHGACFPAGLRACCRASSCAGGAASCVVGLASHGVSFRIDRKSILFGRQNLTKSAPLSTGLQI